MKKILLLLALFASPAYAANVNIDGLPAAASVGGTDLLECEQGGTNRKCTAAQTAAYVYGLMSGDATTAAGGAITFATVNSNVGTFGSATSCITTTQNAKGLTTAISAATCTPAIGSVTGLGTGAATALGVNVGSAGAVVTFNGALGTPSSGVGTNLTGTAAGFTAGNVTTNANLTGMVTSVGNAASLGSFTSANLAAALTNETGSGAAVFGTAPTISSPVISTAAQLSYITGSTQCLTADTAGNVTGTGTACGSGGGGTPGGSTTQVQYNNAGSFGGITGATTNGTALTLVAPVLGTPASGTLTNTTGFPIANLAGAGTGVLAALAINTGSAGAPVLFNGAGGTPSSLTATNLSGTAASLTAGNVTTNANLTGMVTSVGNAASLGSFTSANLATALTDETGSGANVFGTAPTISSLNATTAVTLAFLTGGGTQCLTVSNTGVVGATSCAGGGSVTTVTPGSGLVSGVTASCTQTAITVTGTLSNARCINAQTGTTYTVLDTDRSKQVTLANAAAIAVTLPQAGAASAFASGWFGTFTNTGVGTATFTPTTSTINGVASYKLFSGQSITITSDGTNYQIDPGTTGGVAVNSQTGTNYAFAASDFGKLVNLSNASNQIPTIAVASSLGANWFVQVCNQGAGTQTITPTTSTIGGASTYVLPAASAAGPACVGIVSDGTNYQVVPDYTSNASLLTSGTVAAARGGAGTITGALKGSGAGVVTQAACADLSNGTALCSTTPGTGVTTQLANAVSTAGGSTQTIAAGTSALGTGAISSATCATVVTTSATNVATTDVITAGFNGDPTAVTGYVPLVAGMLTIISYPTANNVNFKVCNNTNASITPGAITLNWRVVR